MQLKLFWKRAAERNSVKKWTAEAADSTIFPDNDLADGWSHHLGNAGCGPRVAKLSIGCVGARVPPTPRNLFPQEN